MDFSYWIILLVVYLLYQWIKRRASRRFAEPTQTPPGEKKREDDRGLPGWLKELGFVDPGEEEAGEAAEIEPEEEIEAFDEEVAYAEPVAEISPVQPGIEVPDLVSKEKARVVSSLRKKPEWISPEVSELVRENRFGNLVYDVGSLRDLIVLREILGPPRAIQRYRSRTRF